MKNILLTMVLIFITSSCSWKVAEFGAISTKEINIEKKDRKYFEQKELKECQWKIVSNPYYYASDTKIHNMLNKMLEDEKIMFDANIEREYFYIPLFYGYICRNITAKSISKN